MERSVLMAIYYGVKVDVSGKQGYIYSSNRLKEVVGASKIIEFVTEVLGRVIIEEMKMEMPNQGLNQEQFTDFFEYKTTSGELKRVRGNVHIEAGGNGIYIFEQENHAKEFTKRFSHYVLEHFEGLEITLATESFDFEKDLGLEFYNKLELGIMKKKNRLNRPLRKFSFGMYDKCGNTGKPKGYEVMEHSDLAENEYVSKFISKESYHKRRFYDEILMDRFNPLDFNQDNTKDFYRIQKHMDLAASPIRQKIIWMRAYYTSNRSEQLSKILPEWYRQKTLLTQEEMNKINKLDFETRLESIESIAGKTAEANYIGLTQLDGNGMGTAMRGLPEHFVSEARVKLEKVSAESDANSHYLRMLAEGKSPAEFKEGLTQGAQNIIMEHNVFFFKFQEILSQELQKVFETAFIQVVAERTKNYSSKIDKAVVPIVMAGDDISFWVTGKNAIPVSVEYIDQIAMFENEKSLKSNIIRRIKKDTMVRKEFQDPELDLYKSGLKIFENLSLSGGTAITLLGYPISQAAKIVGALEKKSKEKGVKLLKGEDESSIFPAIYNWEIVRGEVKDLSEMGKAYTYCGRPYIIRYKGREEQENNFKEFVKAVNSINKLSAVESSDETQKSSKTSYIKRFRMAMDDKNQAKLETYRLGMQFEFGSKEMLEPAKAEDLYGALYDAIEVMGLKCQFEDK